MENTARFLFDNKEEKYFLAISGKAIGPLTAQEIYDKILKAEASLHHYFWKEGLTDWKRLADEKEFSVLIPKKPLQESIDQIRKKIAKKQAESMQDEVKSYFLYSNRTQYGPFSKAEIDHVIASGKLSSQSYVWVSGWTNWKRITEVKEFSKQFKKDEMPPPPVEEKTKSKKLKRASAKADSDGDRRLEPRRPLVARLFLHNNEDVIIAVCRDISVGGMQVLTDRIPGAVGSIIKLNVSPGDPGTSVDGFVAEGEIVRHLDDGRGFSFRFVKISEAAKKAIEKYIRGP